MKTALLRHCALLCVSMLLTACGQVLGAECTEGYSRCGEVCCPSGACSAQGVCEAAGEPVTDGGPRRDGSLRDASSTAPDGGPRRDGSLRDATSMAPDGRVSEGGVLEPIDGGSQDAEASHSGDASPDADRPDGEPVACELGTSRCGAECVDLDFDDANCGACGVECSPDEICALGSCDTTCDAPLVECGGRCVDVASDPLNCGACGVACESELCRPSGCAESDASDVFLVGHSFAERSVAAATMAGNGTLIRLEERVRIVVYDGSVAVPNRSQILAAIETIAAEAGRDYELVAATRLQVPTRLRRADTLVIMPQDDPTTDGELEDIGREWSSALGSFLERGGAIVAFDGDGSHSGTWQILSAADLLAVDGRVEAGAGAICNTITPTDALANELPLTYACPQRTVAFTGTVDGRVVTTDISGRGELPVALHRFVEAPED